MNKKPVFLSWISNFMGVDISCVTSGRRSVPLMGAVLASVILVGCSDGSDSKSGGSGGGEASVVPVIEPADGQTDVARTSWVTMRFKKPLPAGQAFAPALDCGSDTPDVSTDWVGEELLVINPKGELPAQATCTVSWKQGGSRGSSSFEVAATGSPAVVAYDRDDDSTLAPFPDDVWLAESTETRTGYRVELPVPNREPGVQTLYSSLLAATEDLDGYSPVIPLVVPVPGSLDAASLPTTPKQSLDPLATVGLFVADPGAADLGARVPFHLLQRVEENVDGSIGTNLIIFPGELLNPRQRYVLVVTRRALIDATRPLEPSPFFVAARDGELSDGTAAGQRVGELLQETLPLLEEEASPPLYSDDIALAVSFTVRSIEDLSSAPLSIRAQLQELPVPTYTVTSVESVSDPDTEVAALVHGTWEVPTFREGSYIARDDSGRPEYTGTVSHQFVLALPDAATYGPVPITMYQHGQPGSAEVGLPKTAWISSKMGHALIGFTDIANREIIKDGGAGVLSSVVFQNLLVDKRMPEYLGSLPLAEQLAFVRFISGLGDLDVFPVGAPDGVPDLDLSAPLTYLGISQGATHGTALVAYAPEIRAAQLTVGGGYYSGLLIHQVSDDLYALASQFFAGLTRTDLYVNLSLLQMGYDPQDPVNHSRYVYRSPHDLGDTNRASLLVTAGLADTYSPAYGSQAAAWGFGIPHLEPAQSSVPSLELISGPVSANISANTTAAYYQYVPVGVEGVPPTPGCEAQNVTEGHFCPQVAPEALEQTLEFFRSAIEDPAPTIIDLLDD